MTARWTRPWSRHCTRLYKSVHLYERTLEKNTYHSCFLVDSISGIEYSCSPARTKCLYVYRKRRGTKFEGNMINDQSSSIWLTCFSRKLPFAFCNSVTEFQYRAYICKSLLSGAVLHKVDCVQSCLPENLAPCALRFFEICVTASWSRDKQACGHWRSQQVNVSCMEQSHAKRYRVAYVSSAHTPIAASGKMSFAHWLLRWALPVLTHGAFMSYC